MQGVLVGLQLSLFTFWLEMKVVMFGLMMFVSMVLVQRCLVQRCLMMFVSKDVCDQFGLSTDSLQTLSCGWTERSCAI